MVDDETTRFVSLAEVKNILKKVSKERENTTYGQRIALEHAQAFAKLPITKTNNLIKDLKQLNFLEETHVFKIADVLPTTEDDIKALFAKERFTLSANQIKNIIDVVNKHYVK